MFRFLPRPLKGTLSATLVLFNTVFWCVSIYIFAIPKLLPIPIVRRLCSAAMVWIAQTWISGNSMIIAFVHEIRFDVRGLEGLCEDRSYLVSANHQSWVDIVILQHVFNRKIPFARFFLKSELIWVPFLGLAWWALDFPFMKRYSAEYLRKHPEKRGQDLLATRKSCDRFKGSAITVLNFLEGTRFTPQKHQKTESPFQNLLRPKTGGFAFVLECMGTQFDSVLDVTIVYPGKPVTFWELLCGELNEVKVEVRRLPIPADLLGGNYLEDKFFRQRTQNWVTDIWREKDALISRLKT